MASESREHTATDGLLGGCVSSWPIISESTRYVCLLYWLAEPRTRASVGEAVCAGQQQQMEMVVLGREATALSLAATTTRCIRVRWDVAQLEDADLGHIVSAALKSSSTNRRAGHERLTRQPSEDD
jgi:hypothetical protein